jgi:hypothetical protein
MNYIKSFLVGGITAFAGIVLFVVYRIVTVLRSAPPGTAEVGIDVVSLAKSARFQLVLLGGFAIGFWWQFRRK